MRKIFSVMIVALVLSSASFLVSCGDDKDEPVVPKTQKLESVYENDTDARFVFDIDVDKDSSSIYIYNVKFSEQMPVTLNVRIDAPCTSDETGKVYSFAGTNIIPYIMREGTPVPAPSYVITNLTSTVNTGQKTFSIAFDCHGGHYEKSGKLK